MKKKKCKVCRNLYEPWTTIQRACSSKCAIELVKLDKIKDRKKDTRRRKEALKNKSDWMKETQTACNAYIRERDKDLPCISCGTTRPDIQYCAGHYKTKGGYIELRFHPMNIHKQCNQYCNLQLSGNISKYRENLVKKIGISQVEWLEGPHQAQHWTIEDIKEIKAYYKDQLKWLKQGDL